MESNQIPLTVFRSVKLFKSYVMYLHSHINTHTFILKNMFTSIILKMVGNGSKDFMWIFRSSENFISENRGDLVKFLMHYISEKLKNTVELKTSFLEVR